MVQRTAEEQEELLRVLALDGAERTNSDVHLLLTTLTGMRHVSSVIGYAPHLPSTLLIHTHRLNARNILTHIPYHIALGKRVFLRVTLTDGQQIEVEDRYCAVVAQAIRAVGAALATGQGRNG